MSIRLLHTADWHLGLEGGPTDPATGLTARVIDVLERIDEVVGYAIAERIDVFVVAGDVFSQPRPSPTLEVLVAEQIRRLAEAGITVVLVAGDSDQPRLAGQRSPLDFYAALDTP